MGIIDDYLSTDTKAPAAAKSSGLVEQYLNADEKPKASSGKVPVAPPISGASKEDSDALNIEAAKIPPNSVKLPNKAISALSDIGYAGLKSLDDSKNTIYSGVGDILSGKPATGVGKVGLSALVAIPAAASEVISEGVTQLTGNRKAGDVAGLVSTSGIPLAKAGKAAISQLPKNQALKVMVDTIGPENAAEVSARLKGNPRLAPIDVSPTALSQAQKLTVMEGDAAKEHLINASTNRIKSSADTVNAAYDTAAGLPVNAVNKLRELASASKKVGEEKINPAVTGASPVDISGVITHIDDILKPGVMKQITGESTLPYPKTKQDLADTKAMIANEQEQLTDPQSLHRFQSSLLKEAQSRLKSTNAEQRQSGYALLAVRNKIVDAIDAASPQVNGKGTYKSALSEYRDEKHISEAFHDAYNGVLTNSKKLENRPEFTKEWFDGLTDFEKKAAIEGIRTRIDTEIGVAKNPALAGTSLAKSDFNKAKIEAVLGKQETDKLLQTLEDERAISNTHNKIYEGSQTAMRMAGDDRIALSKDKKPDTGLMKYIGPAAVAAAEAGGTYMGHVGLGTIVSTGALGVGKLGSVAKQAIINKLELERNAKVAKYAIPSGPDRQELIDTLDAVAAQHAQPKKSLLSKVGSLASNVVAP